MKKYEIREIDWKEGRRVAVYFTDDYETKTDDYGCWVDDTQIGTKVGFKIEGKSRKTWVHATNTAVHIVNNETGEVTYIKSNPELLEEMGRHDLVERWF